MSHSTLQVIQALGLAAWMAWCAASLFRGLFRQMLGRSTLADAVYFELEPFMPAVLIVNYLIDIADDPRLQVGRTVNLVFCLACWWAIRRRNKDDDDRWKRRRKKLGEKVAHVGGRLQVVPEPVSANG